jgi:hypothetical protein
MRLLAVLLVFGFIDHRNGNKDAHRNDCASQREGDDWVSFHAFKDKVRDGDGAKSKP